MFDTTVSTRERIDIFRQVDYAEGLLVKLGSKETVSYNIVFEKYL